MDIGNASLSPASSSCRRWVRALVIFQRGTAVTAAAAGQVRGQYGG